MKLGFAQTTMPTIEDLWNLPTSMPQGAANPFSIAFYSATPATVAQSSPQGVTGWLQQNSMAVIVIAGALFVLALTGRRR